MKFPAWNEMPALRSRLRTCKPAARRGVRRRKAPQAAALEMLESRVMLTLIGVAAEIETPIIAYNSGGTTEYDATSDSFQVDARPLALLTEIPPPQPITPGAVTIDIEVDSSGNLIGGVAGDDLQVTGTVTVDGDVYTGVLLSGEVTEFGFANSSSTTDSYDFRFSVTGGELAYLWAGSDIGITLTSEQSNFNGSFETSFGGLAKGNIGALEPAFTPEPGIDIEKATNGVDADDPLGPVLPVGSTATFTYVVTNTGNTVLGDVTVSDDNGTPGDTSDDFNPTFVSGDTDGDGLLDLDETWTYEASRIVTAGLYTNVSSVVGNPVNDSGNDLPGLDDPSDSDPSNHFGLDGGEDGISGIDIEKATNGHDADDPTGPYLEVGSTATFTYEVTNTSNVQLADIVVTDDNGTPGDTSDDFNPTFVGGDIDGDGRLDVDEVWTYTAERIVTAGQYTNVSTVVGNPVDENGDDIPGFADQTDSDPSNHFGVTADVDVEKFVKALSGDGLEGFTPGFWKTHSYFGPAPESGWPETGYDPLDSYEAIFGVDAPGDPTLLEALNAGGGGVNALLRHSTAALLNAAHPNVEYAYTTAEVIALVQDAFANNSFETTKDLFVVQNELGGDMSTGGSSGSTGYGDDADTPSGPTFEVGETIVFTYVVTNTSDVDIANVVLVDDNQTPGDASDDFNPTPVLEDGTTFNAGDLDQDGQLDVGEEWLYTATTTVTEGAHVNIATVTGEAVDDDGNLLGIFVTDSDPAHWQGEQDEKDDKDDCKKKKHHGHKWWGKHHDKDHDKDRDHDDKDKDKDKDKDNDRDEHGKWKGGWKDKWDKDRDDDDDHGKKGHGHKHHDGDGEHEEDGERGKGKHPWKNEWEEDREDDKHERRHDDRHEKYAKSLDDYFSKSKHWC